MIDSFQTVPRLGVRSVVALIEHHTPWRTICGRSEGSSARESHLSALKACCGEDLRSVVNMDGSVTRGLNRMPSPGLLRALRTQPVRFTVSEALIGTETAARATIATFLVGEGLRSGAGVETAWPCPWGAWVQGRMDVVFAHKGVA